MTDLEHTQKAQQAFCIVYHREGLLRNSDPIKEAVAATGWSRFDVIRSVTETFDRDIRPAMPPEMADRRWLRTKALWDTEARTEYERKVLPKFRDGLKTQADVPPPHMNDRMRNDRQNEARGKLLTWERAPEKD